MAPKTQGKLGEYRQVGGHLALDFVNTLGGCRGAEVREYCKTYGALVTWAELVGILSPAMKKKLEERAGESTDLSLEVWHRAVALREAIYRVVSANASGNPPPSEDLFLVSREAAFALGRARIVSSSGGAPGDFTWGWPDCDAELERLLWPVARAAADLVTSPDLARVRECGSERCSWVFLDTSKNGRRRWCDMSDCGNREKARRHRCR